MRTPPPITIALALVAIGLWRVTEPHSPPPVGEALAAVAPTGEAAEARTAAKPAPQPAQRLAAVDPEALEEIARRPLFSATRRPLVPPPPEPEPEAAQKVPAPEPAVAAVEPEAPSEPAPPPPLPRLTLKGVMLGDGGASALLAEDGRAATWREEGTKIGDWELHIASEGEIELRAGPHSRRFGLFGD